MSGPVVSAFLPLILTLAHITSPIFQVRKLRLRVINLRAEVSTAVDTVPTGTLYPGPDTTT